MDYFCATLIVDSIASRVPTMSARRSQSTLAATGVLSGLGAIMRPNALRTIFGLLLGVLAALFIGALPLLPRPYSVAMIFNPDTAPGHGKYYMPDFETAARSSQVTPIPAAHRRS